MNSLPEIDGKVEGGRFIASGEMVGLGLGMRLTRLQPQASMPPESEELPLQEYEGKQLRVSGHRDGLWIYSAQIVAVVD